MITEAFKKRVDRDGLRLFKYAVNIEVGDVLKETNFVRGSSDDKSWYLVTDVYKDRKENTVHLILTKVSGEGSYKFSNIEPLTVYEYRVQ